MTDATPRLTPRSAGAIADSELLRVARADLPDAETDASPSLADRIRGLALFRASRPASEDSAGPIRLDRR